MNGSLVLVKSARALAVRNPHSLSVCSAAAPSATRAYHQHHQRTAVLRALGRGDQTTLGPLTRRQGWPQKQLYSSDAQKGVLSPKYASRVKSLFKWFLPQYQGQAIGKAVYERCSTYPDFELFWVKECQLPETFQTWFSTTSLYVWMAMVRIRADPDAKHYNQGLIDAFFRDTEAKIRKSGVKS
ncbi:Ubiquinol cytochrome-c reductase assembly protein Cbp3, partial [Coemansia sp. RSA 2598]